jgi:lipopolysaccharide transport system permease protein
VFVPLLPGILGLIWFFSSLGVYVRDIGMALGMVVSLLMFLCPVFYPASALPAEWQPLIMLNPLSVAIEQMRAVALQGKLPDPMAMLGVSAVSMLFYFLGRTWFRLTRRGFADVL